MHVDAALPPMTTNDLGRGSPPLPGVDVLHFDDIEAQASALTGWNQDYLQLSAGVFQGAIRQIHGTHARIFVEKVQQSVLQTGKLPADVMAIGVPIATSGMGMFCGSPCGADALHVFSGASGFEFRSSQEHIMLGIELRPQQLKSLRTTEHPDQPSPFEFPVQACALRMARETHTEIKMYLLRLLQAAQSNPALLSSPAVVATVEDFLFDRMAPLTTRSVDCDNSYSQWQLVQRAFHNLADELDKTPTIAQLCVNLRVSRRTLQNAFQKVLNVSPLTYLKACRLDQARKALKSAESVTAAATACGFWHFGHFAHDYLAMFGEHPSDTLRRHAAR